MRDSIYAIARICYGNSVRLSVCPSVTLVDRSKTVEPRITQFALNSSPIAVVFFQDKFHPEILTACLRTGASNKGGVGKTWYFLALCVNISKTVGDTSKVTILMTNRKLHMRF